MTSASHPGAALSRAAQRRAEARSLASRIEQARADATASEQRAAESAARAAEEQRDVDRLEHLSWVRIVAALRGSHLSDLEREQAERDAARYAAATERARADEDARSVASLMSQLEALGDVEAAYVAALAVEEEWVASHGGATAARLASIAREQGELDDQDREVGEAIAAGQVADGALGGAQELLNSAAGWAGWDTWGGGGLLTDVIKHQRMEDAQRRLALADQALRAFNRELADVTRSTALELSLNGLNYAFDVWFDNIFSDFAVKRRIEDTLARVSGTRRSVAELLGALAEQRVRLDERRTALHSEREELLVPGPQGGPGTS